MPKYSVTEDPDCYPGTDVLVNKHNIRNQLELERVEAQFTSLAIASIEYIPPPYTLDHLRSIHRMLFSDVYPWAGNIRRVDVSKGSTRFCTNTRIVPEANKLLDELNSKNWLAGLNPDEFANSISHYFCELNVVHPFREGNGRSQRILFEHIALHCNHMIDWSETTKDEWIQANERGYLGDLLLLKEIFKRSLKSIR